MKVEHFSSGSWYGIKFIVGIKCRTFLISMLFLSSSRLFLAVATLSVCSLSLALFGIIRHSDIKS